MNAPLEKPGRTVAQLMAMTPALRADSFAGKTILVSGAGSGIGRASAIFLAKLGANIVTCARRIERLEETADAIRALGREAHCVAMSIREPDSVAGLIDQAWERFGRLDAVVNNAGGQFPQAAIDFSVKGWNAVIDTNLNGPWYMMQAAARRWRDAGVAGNIVNIVAVVTRGMPGVAHTCAARAGIVHASKTVAIEWAPLNIRVNCIAPGIIATEGMEVYPDEARRAMPRSNPMQRFGQVEDVANAVCYLASDASSFMTGEVITIDGGFQLWGSQWTIPEPAYFRGEGTGSS